MSLSFLRRIWAVRPSILTAGGRVEDAFGPHLGLRWRLSYGTVFSRAWRVSLRVCVSKGAEQDAS